MGRQQDKNMHLQEKEISKSLKFSFIEGIFASGMTGFIQDYLTPFLLILNATVKQVGMLNALPNFFASLIQLKSADFAEKLKSRRRIINGAVFLQALMLPPMVIIALFSLAKPYFFITTVVFFASFGALAVPAWASLMSDLVEEDKRGEYFGWRNRALGFIIVGATFLAGCVLYQMKKTNVFYGFAGIFSAAFICRIISWHFLRKMSEPQLEHKKEDSFTLFNFLAKTRESNFAKFVLFVSMMNFSINLSAPFISVLMLKNLSFSYLLYSILTITATLAIYAAISRWGRHADRVGNLKIIKFTARLIGIVPLLWIINRQPVFLIFVQIFAGFLWAGFSLCASNFIYDAVTPAKRTRCIAYFNVLNGLAIGAGALLGGVLIDKLPMLFGHKILTLFLISAVLRLLVGIFVPQKIKEVRPREKIKSNKLFFSMIGIKPLLGVERKTISYHQV